MPSINDTTAKILCDLCDIDKAEADDLKQHLVSHLHRLNKNKKPFRIKFFGEVVSCELKIKNIITKFFSFAIELKKPVKRFFIFVMKINNILFKSVFEVEVKKFNFYFIFLWQIKT